MADRRGIASASPPSPLSKASEMTLDVDEAGSSHNSATTVAAPERSSAVGMASGNAAGRWPAGAAGGQDNPTGRGLGPVKGRRPVRPVGGIGNPGPRPFRA